MPKVNACHNLCLLDTERDIHIVYKKISEYLADGYAVIYTSNQNPTQIVSEMSSIGIEIQDHVKSGALSLLSPKMLYSKKKRKFGTLKEAIDTWQYAISKNNAESKFKGLLAIGNPFVFFRASTEDELIAKEQEIGKEFTLPVEAICCYEPKMLEKMAFRNIMRLLYSHNSTISSSWNYRQLRQSEVTKIILDGVDKILGKGSGKLLASTLKLVYKIDIDNTAVTHPDVIEDAITRITGDSSKIIFKAIADEIVRQNRFNDSS